jgi:SAM-dependent methyltransferase
MNTAQIKKRSDRLAFFEDLAPVRTGWRDKNSYYHELLERYYSFAIPRGTRVVELGCGNGDLLASLRPSFGVGIDWSARMLDVARTRHPNLTFIEADIESMDVDETFDYVVVSDVIGFLHDVQGTFERIKSLCHDRTRIVISYYSYLWEPILGAAAKLGEIARQPPQNWLTAEDIDNLLRLAGIEVVSHQRHILLPRKIPFISEFVNRWIAHLPFIQYFSLLHFCIARPIATGSSRPARSCSIVIPCRNESGTIEAAVTRLPKLSESDEILFVEGNSTDDTRSEIERVIAANPQKNIRLVPQGDGRGKGDAVRKGFAAATGEILLILDADLTVSPEDMPRFVNQIANGNGEFIHGSRLVYPMESEAMRFLNKLGNKFFSAAFTFLLGQQFKDTLCGTKVLRREDYLRIAAGRSYFGDFDPFGDFDLLFGAAKLGLKIIEVPVHYLDRTYGSTNISRFKHGWLLLQMVALAAGRIKFR